jgi:hypothetical protein
MFSPGQRARLRRIVPARRRRGNVEGWNGRDVIEDGVALHEMVERASGLPAEAWPTTLSGPGVSAARTAKPSIAELSNGGRSVTARAAAARTRPAASATRTSSVSSGVALCSTRDSASSILGSVLTAVHDNPQTWPGR